MVSLPRCRQVVFDSVLVEYVGTTTSPNAEHRLVLGEHNGERWLDQPKTIILSKKESDDQVKLSASGAQLEVYLKVKIHLEEVVWHNEQAKREILYSGFVHVHSKKKYGQRVVLLQKRSPNPNIAPGATAVFTIYSGKEAAMRSDGNVLAPVDNLSKTDSEVFRILRGATTNSTMVKPALKSQKSQNQLFEIKIDFISITRSSGLPLPSVLIGDIFTCRERQIRINLPKITQTGQSELKIRSPCVEFTAPLDQSREVQLSLRHGPWRVGCFYFVVNPSIVNVPFVPDSQFGSLLPIKQLTLSITTKRVSGIKLDPNLSLPRRLPPNRPVEHVEPSLADKIRTLQSRHRLLNLSEPALAEQMRLQKMAHLGKPHKECQIEKEVSIYNTLVDSVTEKISLVGTAGSQSRHGLRVDNFHDWPIKLTIESIPSEFTLEGAVTLNELGQAELEVGACDSATWELSFFPITPQDQFDECIDLITENGSVFKRFRLVGTVVAPYQYDRIELVERESAKVAKELKLGITVDKNTKVHYEFDQGDVKLGLREDSTLILQARTLGSLNTLHGWVHILNDQVAQKSLYITLTGAQILHAELDEGSSMWLDLPVDLPIDRPLEVSYSHPGDFDFGDGGVEQSLRCNENRYQICLYGFKPGSFRRHLCMSDTRGARVGLYLMLLEISPIRITRSYDVSLNGRPGMRQIEIENPYPESRLFKMHTSRTGGIMLNQSSIQLEAKQTAHIELNLSGRPGKHMVFINDQRGNLEEAFAVHVR